MTYLFGPFELDTDRIELRANGLVVPIEPQVFQLLQLLIESHHRMVSKDEIIEKVWHGRSVSDSAISSRIKSARQALGDDGRLQSLIHTVHGQGFSFIGDVSTRNLIIVQSQDEPTCNMLKDQQPAPPSRPSLAVLPFEWVGTSDVEFPIAEALPHDLITELSRLHWLFVIARGSSFRFRSAGVDLDHVRRKLAVRYCLTGAVEMVGKTLFVSVELSDTADKGIIWSERFHGEVGSVHAIRDQIISAVTGAVEVRIPFNEAKTAQLKSPETLDAWSAYHLGLLHMYRFNKTDNGIATGLFERSIRMEPEFARAYAGLSFTHFQNSFLRHSGAADSTKLARHYANLCLERDPLDPFGHLTMGRAFWLTGDLEVSLPWLERANALNPNYAQARYSRGWTEALLGAASESQSNIDAALALSPLDPLVYGMLGARALSCIGQNSIQDAVLWAERAAYAPGAHGLIAMIAATAQSLNGNDERARMWASLARERATHLDKDDFLRAFPFRDELTRQRVVEALGSLGF
jgi:TolB-like protein